MQKKILDIHRSLLQNAISGELSSKMTEWRNLKNEISMLSDQYQEMVEEEEFLRDEYRLDELEREFIRKRLEFYNRADILRLIFLVPAYLN